MYWNDVWDEAKHRLEAMTPPQRLTFCLACLEWSLRELRDPLRAVVGDERVRQLRHYLDAVPGHPARVETAKSESELSEEVGELVAAVEDEAEEANGFYDLGMGVVELLDSLESAGLPARETYYVASYAYQAVFTVEVLASLEETVTETVTTEMETKNRRCLAAIETQLELATAVAAGKNLGDLGLYPRT
jgi:hypothetical protein